MMIVVRPLTAEERLRFSSTMASLVPKLWISRLLQTLPRDLVTRPYNDSCTISPTSFRITNFHHYEGRESRRRLVLLSSAITGIKAVEPRFASGIEKLV